MSSKTIFVENKIPQLQFTSNNWQALGMLLIFILSLLVCLAYNFWWEHPKSVLVTDSISYLRSTGYVTNFLLSLWHGQANFALFTDPQQVDAILLDGPIMTSIYGLLFALIGHVPSHQDWAPLVFGHSVFQALSACLVTALAYRITGSKTAALLAATAWACYPAAIIASGRYLSETPAVFFLLLAVWCLVKASSQRLAGWWLLAAGFLIGLISLLRLALMPALVLCAVVVLLNARHKMRALFTLSTGVVLALCPWALYTKVATGTAHFVTGRGPMFGCFGVGWDTEAQAWWTMPPSALNQIYSQSDGMLGAELAEWYCHFPECLALSLAKLTRLFAEPWNNLYQRCLGLDALQQVYWHQILLYLGLLGVVGWFLLSSKTEQGKSRIDAKVCMIALLCPLPYLLFECPNRYGFASFPFVVIFAAVGLWLSWRILKTKTVGLNLYLVTSAIAAAIFLTVICSEGVCQLGLANETSHRLAAGEKIVKTTVLSGMLPEGQDVLLLVDGDKALESADVRINEFAAPDHLMSINHFDTARYRMFGVMREITPLGKCTKDLRQWRAVKFPRAWLKANAANTVTIVLKEDQSTIYGDSINSRIMLSPDYCAPQKLANKQLSYEARIPNPILTHAVQQVSYVMKPDLTAIKLPDSLRVKFAFPVEATGKAAVKAKNVPGGVDVFTRTLTADDFHLLMRDHDSVKISRWIIKACDWTGVSINVPRISPSTHLGISVQGDLRADVAGKAGLLVALTDGNGAQLVLGELPGYLQAQSRWSHFKIEDLIPLGTISGQLDKVSLSLYPCPWDQAQYGAGRSSVNARFRNLKVEVKAVDSLDTFGQTVVYY